MHNSSLDSELQTAFSPQKQTSNLKNTKVKSKLFSLAACGEGIFSPLACQAGFLFISREMNLKNKLFMQNKPNFRPFCTKNEGFKEKQTQNKANQSQFKPNSNPIQTQFWALD